MLSTELDFGLCNDSWFEYHSNIFGTLYYMDTLKHIQYLLAFPTLQVHLNVELVCLATQNVAEYTAKPIWEIGGGLRRINFLLAL